MALEGDLDQQVLNDNLWLLASDTFDAGQLLFEGGIVQSELKRIWPHQVMTRGDIMSLMCWLNDPADQRGDVFKQEQLYLSEDAYKGAYSDGLTPYLNWARRQGLIHFIENHEVIYRSYWYDILK